MYFFFAYPNGAFELDTPMYCFIKANKKTSTACACAC